MPSQEIVVSSEHEGSVPESNPSFIGVAADELLDGRQDLGRDGDPIDPTVGTGRVPGLADRVRQRIDQTLTPWFIR